MKDTEQVLSSREVSEMVEKNHNELLKDIRRYCKQFSLGKIPQSDFFIEATYKTDRGKEYPCYKVTKKGCEFIAHKLTGTKGTVFTARYINRFHEMEDIISNKETEPVLPWFIHNFRGKYIMLFRDFEAITGVHLSGNYTSLKRTYHLTGGHDYNGWEWYTSINKEEFKQKYGFDYGDDQCMMYLYPCGIVKALDIFKKENPDKYMETCTMITSELKQLAAGRIPKKQETGIPASINETCMEDIPVQVKIFVNGKTVIF